MKLKTHWLLALPLTALVGAAFLLGIHSRPDGTVAPTFPALEAPLPETPADNALSRDATQRNARRIRQLSAHIARLERALDRRATAEQAAEEIEDEEVVSQRRAALGRLEKAERTKVLETRLATEAKDAAWASRAEGQMREVVSAHFPESEVVSTNCLSTVCKMTVAHGAGATSWRQFVSDFPLKFQAFDEMHHNTAGKSTERPQTTLHIVRKGSGDTFNAELQAQLSWQANE